MTKHILIVILLSTAGLASCHKLQQAIQPVTTKRLLSFLYAELALGTPAATAGAKKEVDGLTSSVIFEWIGVDSSPLPVAPYQRRSESTFRQFQECFPDMPHIPQPSRGWLPLPHRAQLWNTK